MGIKWEKDIKKLERESCHAENRPRAQTMLHDPALYVKSPCTREKSVTERVVGQI